MKINDLSRELNVENKVLIDYLKKLNFEARSHMQNATDEMIDAAREHFKPITENVDVNKEKKVVTENEKKNVSISVKKFEPTDLIPCRSVLPNKLAQSSVDRMNLYSWEYYGDIEYVAYKDLQAWRKKEIVTSPMIIIEDPDIREQWKRELEDIYQYYLNVEYPEDFFEMPDSEFTKLLENAPASVKDVIKSTAIVMIRNKNYPTVQKLTIVDQLLGTCLKEFL